MKTNLKLSSMFVDRRSCGVYHSHFHQLATCHPEIRQREQRCQLRGVFLQTTVACFREAELPFDHPKRMLYLGSDACLKVFDFIDDAIKRVGLVPPRTLAQTQCNAT